MIQKLLAHAAEAKLFLDEKENEVIKHRVPKNYRLSVIDVRLRKQRTRREARLLQKAALLVSVPRIFSVDETRGIIKLEYIKGKKLADCLDFVSLRSAVSLCTTLGACLAKLHDADIIHGDLTTSNTILTPQNKLYLIDFGLSFESSRIEDKAVDLHLLKEALEARHPNRAVTCLAAIFKGYSTSKKAKETYACLKNVEKRGRYKQQF
jgi:TP53 regulating kinase-like protein